MRLAGAPASSVNFITEGTIAPVREIVIVMADLYLPAEVHELTDANGTVAALPPALAHALRYGTHAALPRTWREWLAHWLGRPDLAAASVAGIAAAGIGVHESGPLWLATPMHWMAGMSGVHLDARAILRLEAGELERLAGDFNSAFRHSAVLLRPLPGGELLAHGPEVFGAHTVEPARLHLAGLADAQPAGGGAAGLRRLGSEIEMWLRDQALNRARAARGERPVSALWFWGGSAPAPPPGPQGARLAAPGAARPPYLALGTDAYLAGLSRLTGAAAAALPPQLAPEGGTGTAGTVLVFALGSLPAPGPWSLAVALAEADRRFVAPALQALRRGACRSLTLLANDHCVQLRAQHRWRAWRRAPAGLEGLR